MQFDPGRSRLADGATEFLLIAITCLTPWAFGSVEAWALTAIDAGVLLLAILGLFHGRSRPERARRACLPEIALASLALLGFVQTFAIIPGPSGPTSAAGSGNHSTSPERVVGDPGPTVALPAGTISRLPEETRNAAWRLVSAWVVFHSVIGLRGGSASLRRFGTAVVVNAGALSLFAMIQALTWNGKIYWFRATPQEGAWFAGGPFVCHSHLAAYLNIGLGFALGSLIRPGKRGPRLWTAYGTALIAAGVVASQSRSGFVAMLGAQAVVLCLNPKFLRYAAGAAAATVLAGLLLVVLPSGQALDRLATLFDPNSRGYTARFEIWEQAVEAWRAHPIWGWGFGSFGAAIAPFGVRDRGVFFARAENEYLDLLVEGGVVGLGVALMGVVGLAILARRAMRAETGSRDGLIVPGAVFGLVALMIQSLGDFALHIPAIAITATILAAHVCGIGLMAEVRSDSPTTGPSRAVRTLLMGAASMGLAIAVLLHDLPRLRAEAAMAGSDLPLPATSSPSLRSLMIPRDILERRLTALEAMLRYRPDWAEGHLRRGITLVALYERSATEIVEESTGDAKKAASLGDSLWLHGVMHPRQGPPPVSTAELIEHEPVRRFLIPAARSFLEARRCGEIVPQSHAGLASLDFLLDGGDPSRSHIRRADELAGSDRQIHIFLAEVASQAGDLTLAASSFKRALRASDLGWESIADRTAELFRPEEILRDIIPTGGRLPLLFANRLHEQTGDLELRDRFLRVAIERLPGDRDLPPSERLRIEALAWASLEDRGKACERMELALDLDPSNGDWRQDLGRWLLDSGRAEAAYRQALIGLQLCPGHAGLARVRDDAAEARARGDQMANGRVGPARAVRNPPKSLR